MGCVMSGGEDPMVGSVGCSRDSWMCGVVTGVFQVVQVSLVSMEETFEICREFWALWANFQKPL